MSYETSITHRIQKARTALLLDHPFFGALLFRLKGRETQSVRTMATDGVSLFYNPEFVETLSSANLAGVLAHEVMHPALHHHVRRSGRNPRRWNEACDYAINPLLLDAGLSLPKGILFDPRFRGMSAEQIFSQLETEAGEQSDDPEDDFYSGNGGTGDGNPEPTLSDEPSAPATKGGIGQVLDAPLSTEENKPLDEQSREWSVAVSQAATVASRAGKVPAGVQRALEGVAKAAVDWRELLRRLWSEMTPADYSWARPNRRYIWAGLYLPGVIREGVGEIAIAVDCSGSVHGRQLRLFEAEICSILAGQRTQRVHVLYFDTVVHKIESYEAGQPIHLDPVGGGGTAFGPCFEWLDEHGVEPQTLVFFTDLWGTFPVVAPPYPVLWASIGSRHAPFGHVIPMQSA